MAERLGSKEEENEDEWEYYDDATTLSDLWQFMVDNQEQSPIEYWLQEAEKAPRYPDACPDLDLALRDYWRIAVPRKLSPGHSHTSVDQPWNRAAIKACLIDPLEQFICGQDDAATVFKELTANDVAPPVCGKLFEPGQVVYSCRECGQDATCVMCADCFIVSEHTHHNYRMSTSEGGGCCDCGDREAFPKHHLCQIHKELADKQISSADVLKSLPSEVKERTRRLFVQILKYSLEVTGRHKRFQDLLVGEKDKETWPDLRYCFQFSNHCLLLINDDSHSYDEVIRVLMACLKCAEKRAVDVTEFVHREGRGVLKVGNYKDCMALREQIENYSRRDGKSLKLVILPAYVVAHQNFAVRLSYWLLDLFKICSGFRALFAEVAYSVDDSVMVEVDSAKYCMCEAILIKGGLIWKEVRRVWFSLIVEGILKDSEAKLNLAQLYIQEYKTIMMDFISDDQESDVAITNLSVQIFTVPSIAHNLIEEFDAFHVMTSFFFEIMAEQSEYNNGKLILEKWMVDEKAEFERTESVLTDLQYLVGVPPTQWTAGLRKNFLKGLESFLSIIDHLQGADAHRREINHHVEFESMEWEHVYKISTTLMILSEYVREWCRKDKEVLSAAIKMAAERCTAPDMKQVLYGCTVGSKTKTYSLFETNVLTDLVSIHTPLQRFIAGIGMCMDDYPSLCTRAADRLQTHCSLIELVDPVLTTLTVLAQTKIGMWKRNGSPMEGQQYIYHHPQFGGHAKRSDLVLLQLACSLMDDPGHVVMALLHRFRLLPWATGEMDRQHKVGENSEIYERTHALADECLLVIVSILMERSQRHVGQVSLEEEVKNKVVHQLCTGNVSHSEVIKNTTHDVKTENIIEDLLVHVADHLPCKKEPSKKVYHIKQEYVTMYNPMHYFYTREQRDSAEETQLHSSKADKARLCPPPEMPPLKPLFQGLTRLTRSLPVLQIMVTTLKRFLVARRPAEQHHAKGSAMSSQLRQLHKVLYLIIVGYTDDLSSGQQSPDFTREAEEAGIFQLLEQVSVPEDLKDLLGYAIDKANEARGSLLKLKSCSSSASIKSDASSSSDYQEEAQARKRRAEAAASKRAKVMAQMTQMQKNFIKGHATEYDALMDVDVASNKGRSAKAVVQHTSKPIAAGPQRTIAHFTEKRYTCILCQEEQCSSNVEDPLVIAAYVVKCSIMCQQKQVDPSLENASVSCNYLPASMRCAPTVTSCGHVMHSSCYQKLFDSLIIKTRETHFKQILNYNVNDQEYLCPICERLSNSVLPLMPSPTAHLQVTEPSQETFSAWVKSTKSVLSQIHVETPAAGAAERTGTEYITRLAVEQGEVEATSKYPKVPLSEALTNMTNVFAVNVFTKSLSLLPPGTDDCRALQVCTQMCALSIQLTQAKDEMDVLLLPLSPREEDVLRSLVRLCVLLPYCQRADSKPKVPFPLQKALRSHALFLLSMMMLGDQRKSFLHLDALNVLVMLTCSVPALYEANATYQHDQHVLRLCTVMHLAQVLSGLGTTEQEEMDSGVQEEDDDDVETAYVCRLQKWMSSVVSSRNVLSKLKAATVKRKMIRFLRGAALFYHMYTDVPLPHAFSDDEEVTTSLIYKRLTEYLGIPTDLSLLLTGSTTMDVVNGMLANEKLKTVIPVELPAKRRELITLPDDYSVLLNKAADFKCPNNVSGDCKTPTLCLVCGTVLCSQSHCCERVMDKITCGACTVHSRVCGAGTGVFLRLRKCQIALLSDLRRGALFPAPYVDRYGEHDEELNRGNPLKLDKSQYEELNRIWISNDVPDRISRSFDSDVLLLSARWYTL